MAYFLGYTIVRIDEAVGVLTPSSLQSIVIFFNSSFSAKASRDNSAIIFLFLIYLGFCLADFHIQIL
jgi:hypothetical protein